MSSRAFLIGGGIGSLAAAAFMIRDGGIPGANIAIFEAAPLWEAVSTVPEIPSADTRCAAAAC